MSSCFHGKVCDICLQASFTHDVWHAYFYNGITRSPEKLMQCHLCYHCDKTFKKDGVTMPFTEKEADVFVKAGVVDYDKDNETDENPRNMWWIMKPLYCEYPRRWIDPTDKKTVPYLINFTTDAIL